METSFLKNKNVAAWLAMVVAIAYHVVNEATTGFLPFYNEFVLEMREKIGFFPAPTFTFGLWLAGLIGAALVLASLTPFVERGKRWMRILSTVLGVLMIINALLHMLGSIYFGETMPGFWSSPLLLITAIYVVYRGFRGEWGS